MYQERAMTTRWTRWAAWAALLLAAVGCGSAGAERAPLTVMAVGDITMGRAWPGSARKLPPDAARPIFAPTRSILGRADLTFGNLETVLADRGKSKKCHEGAKNCYAFRVPTAYARTLAETGFDLLSVNNNHANDYGRQGRQETIRALDEVGIAYSGVDNGPVSVRVKGRRVAMLAFAYARWNPYRIQDLTKARTLVAALARDNDIVIVSFHGGAEGAGKDHVPKRTETAWGEDRGDVYAFAHAVVDAGADLVLGHGPHVLRAMEVYKGRLIAYSLGNFSAWGTFRLRGPSALSAILEVSLRADGELDQARLHPLRLRWPGIPTPDPSGRSIATVRRLSLHDLGVEALDADGRIRGVRVLPSPGGR